MLISKVSKTCSSVANQKERHDLNLIVNLAANGDKNDFNCIENTLTTVLCFHFKLIYLAYDVSNSCVSQRNTLKLKYYVLY